ncbi:MAG: hypothetical protein EOO51_08440 [Flavobacterium sp.]|nr:MAG: hypothetical protein EOO51_08440 [Flavobacterium sp.]
MQLYYHLPAITYDFTNSRFEDFDFDVALKYLKLIFKDSETFQIKFLRKLENIPDLDGLCVELGAQFDRCRALSPSELSLIANEDCRALALKHFEEWDVLPKIKNEGNFLEKLKERVQEYLVHDAIDFERSSFFYTADLVQHKTPHVVNKIKNYTVDEAEEFVHFKVSGIENLELSDTIRYFVCHDCDIKMLQPNQQLLYLDVCFNRIEQLQPNDDLHTLEVSHNQLKYFHCNAHLKSLHITDNKLESIQLNDALESITCSSNFLDNVVLNASLKEANFRNNPLTYIRLNRGLEKLCLSHPENKAIEIDNSAGNDLVVVNYFIN